MESSKAVKKDYNELSLSDIFMYLFKYRIIIIVCIIAGAAAGVLAFIRQKQQAPVLSYYAKATMIVTSKNVEGSYQASGSPDYASASDIYFAQTLVLSTAELAKSNYVLNLVIPIIGNKRLTPEMIAGAISCRTIEKTAFIEVTSTWPDEKESIAIVNALMDVLPQAMIDKLNVGGVNVVDYADKAYVIEPKKPNIFMIYIAAGIVLGSGSAVLLGILNRKVLKREDIDTYLKVNTIADIPYCRKSPTGSRLVSDPESVINYRESCFVFASVFKYIADRKDKKVIYVTSAISGEGKTTLAINLALSLAHKGDKVILIDCDMCRPAVAEMLGLDKNRSSLQDVLAGRVKTEDALTLYKENCLVLASDICETPLDADKLGSLIGGLRQSADYIIIDTPPVGLASDALLLNSCVDGVLFVIRHDHADMGLIADTINYIKDSGADIIGCVFNAEKKHSAGGHYSKNRYYKYYYKSAAKTKREQVYPSKV